MLSSLRSIFAASPSTSPEDPSPYTPQLPAPFTPHSALTSSDYNTRNAQGIPGPSILRSHRPPLLTIQEVDSSSSVGTSGVGSAPVGGLSTSRPDEGLDGSPEASDSGYLRTDRQRRSSLGNELDLSSFTTPTSSRRSSTISFTSPILPRAHTTLDIIPYSSPKIPPDHDEASLTESDRAELEAEGPPLKWHQTPLVVAGIKLSILFVLFGGLWLGTLWYGVPPLDPHDRPLLKLPKSFEDLKGLNTLFQKYKKLYPMRILTCGVVTYLFVQAFSLPGSMYISILFGAAYGMIYGLLLSCVSEASGALLCFALSAIVGPPLLTIPAYRKRLESWRIKIMGDASKGEAVTWDGIFAFLIVLRIAPFPPHWMANVVCPHLGISPLLFWAAVFVGIAPVSVIHVTIGSGLDSMTSAEDFHILSLRNILGLTSVGVAVMIPVGLKRVFKKDLSGLSEAEAALANPNANPHLTISSPNSSSSSLYSYERHPEDDTSFDDAYSYQGQDSGIAALEVETRPRHRADKGKGRAMDLGEALDRIRGDGGDEEELMYDGDEDEDEMGIRRDKEKFDELHGEPRMGSRENGRRGRKGYGTMEPAEDEEMGVSGEEWEERTKSWWQIWK